MERVFVTGCGVVTPLGCTVESFWRGLVNGESGCRALDLSNVAELPVRVGGQVSSGACPDRLPAKITDRMSRASLFAYEAVRQALDQAGLSDSQNRGIGMFMGTSVGGFVSVEPYFKAFFEDGHTSPFGIVKPMNSAPAAHVAILFGLNGPSLTFDTACSSANNAIGNAFMHIRHGRLDHAVAGGCDTPFSPAVFASWCAVSILSKDSDRPAEACRPFSACRTGTVLSEGAAMLVLESERAVRQRQVEPLAEIVGYGASCDAYHLTHARDTGARAAICSALRDAEVDPADVGFISAHGTGTRLNDEIEGQVLSSMFGGGAGHVRLSATKGATGHMLAASAAIEAVITVQALHDGLAPPSINCRQPEGEVSALLTHHGPAPITTPIAVSNSFGFGGSNAVLVMRRV